MDFKKSKFNYGSNKSIMVIVYSDFCLLDWLEQASTWGQHDCACAQWRPRAERTTRARDSGASCQADRWHAEPTRSRSDWLLWRTPFCECLVPSAAFSTRLPRRIGRRFRRCVARRMRRIASRLAGLDTRRRRSMRTMMSDDARDDFDVVSFWTSSI